MADESGEIVKLDAGAKTRAPMTRREAMLELLRVGGVAAARRGWRMAERAQQPASTGAGCAGAARSSRGCRCRVAADDGCAGWRAAGAGRAGDSKSWRHGPVHQQAGRGGAEAEHCLGPHAEQAANTNPDLVAEVVRQCWQAGARRVIVTDVSCGEPQRCFHRSGSRLRREPRGQR